MVPIVSIMSIINSVAKKQSVATASYFIDFAAVIVGQLTLVPDSIHYYYFITDDSTPHYSCHWIMNR